MADTARTLCDCPEPCQVKTACVRKIMTLMATVNDDPAQRYSLLTGCEMAGVGDL